MKKIYIATTSFSSHSNEPLKILKENNFLIRINKKGRKLSNNEILKELIDSDGVIAGTELYPKEVLRKLPKLKVISRLGIGIDNIDLISAQEEGIQIFKTDTTPGPAVVELALNLMLDVSRMITVQNNELKNGVWNKRMGNLLQGKTLGIIGLGSIGKSLVKLVKGFNFKILAFDLIKDITFASKNQVNYCSLNYLLKNSDIISIHLNLNQKTKRLLSKKEMSLMKKNAILINTSRGGIIDEKSLFEVLKNKKILGAGLDVFEEEPYKGELLDLENIITTPHIGSYAKELRIQMEIETVKNLIRGFNEF
jgi:D-3-phosphoglycerate dehydrogenase / 2-oxoglutarate reductase